MGVAGAVLAFFALTLVQALAINPYLPPDELYHTGYAAVVGDGGLPTLTTPVPVDDLPFPPRDGRPRRIYTANHPPLFYAVASVALRVGPPRLGFVAARMLSAGFGAAGVVMVAWLALLLVPGRPRVAVGAAWFVALLPAVPHYSAFLYNDGLGFLAATAVLVGAALLILRGPAPWHLAGLTVAAAAAALTRAPGVALLGVAVLAAALGAYLHGGRERWRRLALAAGCGALVGGLAGASSIWFYLRNQALYGELTASQYNQALFGFAQQRHAARLATSPSYVLELYDGLWVWTRFALRQIQVPEVLVLVPRVVAVAVLVGLAVAAVRAWRGRAGGPPPLPISAARLLALAWLGVLFLLVTWYDGNGGHTHPRYLLPAIAVVAVAAAAGLDELPGARRGLWTLPVSLAQLALTLLAWPRFVDSLGGRHHQGLDVVRAVVGLLRRHEVPLPWLLLGGALLVLLAALAAQQVALRLLAGDDAPQPGRPAPAPEAPVPASEAPADAHV